MAADKKGKRQESDFIQQKILQALKHRNYPKLPLRVIKVSNGYIIGHLREPYGDWFPSKEPFLEECAKIQFIKSRNIWKLYWMRSDLKWHGYGEYSSFEAAIKEIDRDPYGCFFG
ncbi:MAG: DUF3024 domain-containing protein [Actinomycetota bacterium]|nr:DUF3024 domain-containing protein [Actinomycetota bacterium]MDI6821661.1 DUF3024 domain-containing protein [Actinomycetota bacterium]